MSDTANPTPIPTLTSQPGTLASTVPASPQSIGQGAGTGIFDRILLGLELATEIMAAVPSPAMPFAAIALPLERIVGSAIRALAVSKGQTVDEVIAQLHKISEIP